MPIRPAEPDVEMCFAALLPSEREAVERFCELFGAPAAGWREIPPLRNIVIMAGVVTMAAGMPGAGGDSIRSAVEALGLDDDSELNAHPGEKYLRKLRRWRGSADKDVRSEIREAA